MSTQRPSPRASDFSGRGASFEATAVFSSPTVPRPKRARNLSPWPTGFCPSVPPRWTARAFPRGLIQKREALFMNPAHPLPPSSLPTAPPQVKRQDTPPAGAPSGTQRERPHIAGADLARFLAPALDELDGVSLAELEEAIAKTVLPGMSPVQRRWAQVYAARSL